MTTLTRKYHPGDVPERVIRAARSMLDEVPAREISMRELARQSRVSHGAPYRHFGDRDGFLTALAEHCFDEFVEAQQHAFTSASPGQQLSAVGHAYVEFAVDHPHAFALIFDPSINPTDGPPPGLAERIDRHREVLSAALLDAVESGRLRANASPDDVAAAMWAAAHGLAQLAATGRIKRERVPAVLDALLDRP